MSLFVVEPGNKLTLVRCCLSCANKENFMILSLICCLLHTICILLKSENTSSPFDLDFSHLMNADYFLFSFLEGFVFFLFLYKVQNDSLIKSVCFLKVNLFSSYFKLPPLEASATALENEATWDKYNLT